MLDTAELERLRGLIRERGILSLAPGYAPNHRVFGGDMEILEVRLDGEEHRVITDLIGHPAFSAVRDAARAMVHGR